jgi:hypothetical protein
VWSAATGTRVVLDEVLGDAHAAALRNEKHADVRAALTAWDSPRAGLSTR